VAKSSGPWTEADDRLLTRQPFDVAVWYIKRSPKAIERHRKRLGLTTDRPILRSARVSQSTDFAAILNAINENPDDGNRWLAPASWLWDNGRDDEALVVRVLWPTLRDNVADTSLKATLVEVKRSAKRLVKWARKIEARADDTPTDESPDAR
jgi:uncharacterized protein (TIGR02996 family)